MNESEEERAGVNELRICIFYETFCFIIFSVSLCSIFFDYKIWTNEKLEYEKKRDENTKNDLSSDAGRHFSREHWRNGVIKNVA